MSNAKSRKLNRKFLKNAMFMHQMAITGLSASCLKILCFPSLEP